ncbi:MAG: TetR/AcrR family transcriptional regulator [Corynebacteriales bacterium]|nr:TetR/AcrR family transcriptional regulator [Mycobacteriales bacterium]
MIDGRLQRGERTRLAVLDAAVALASVEGLEGFSLARLAQNRGVSKAGLFAHWPSKQQLQLAIVERAQEQWVEFIVQPALKESSAVRQLWALHEKRLGFYEKGVLPGGCFFATVGAELADRPGPISDAIASANEKWMDLLVAIARRAIKTRELRAETNPEQLGFEIQALGEAVIVHTHLLHRDRSYQYARRAVLDRLRHLSTDPHILPES